MLKRNLSIMLASVAILGASLAGCSSTGLDRRPALADGAGAVPHIEEALARKEYSRALIEAEQLVAAEPRDGDVRALLGRAYLANGRYASARTAFTDAMTLGNRDSRTIVSLALCETGLKDSGAARALLSTHIQALPASDYGLAMTMAGDPREGVRALLEAVRMPDATAKTRQNLAYALAMAGAWGQARLIAGQDLSAKDAEARIGQWSAIADQGKESDRVIAMIGVAPRADDAGLPERLALDTKAQSQAAPSRVASVDDLIERASQQADAVTKTVVPAAAPSVASAVQAPVVSQPSSPSEPTMLAAAFRRDDTAASPIVTPQAAPTRDALAALFTHDRATSAETLAGSTRVSRVSRIALPADDAQASDWVVQLGAYDSEAVARDKWQRISADHAALAGFQPVNSTFERGGRTFHRLAVRGFGDRNTALSTCSVLRNLGQACFVRLDDTDTTRMARAEARRKSERLAASASGKEIAVASR